MENALPARKPHDKSLYVQVITAIVVCTVVVGIAAYTELGRTTSTTDFMLNQLRMPAGRGSV